MPKKPNPVRLFYCVYCISFKSTIIILPSNTTGCFLRCEIRGRKARQNHHGSSTLSLCSSPVTRRYHAHVFVHSELFAKDVPRTAENFRSLFSCFCGGWLTGMAWLHVISRACRCLCTGEKGVGKTTKKPLHYKGSIFHRVVN